MMETAIDINTPETLGVTPRYLLQYNAICRSAHHLSATAQKLAAMAMALLPHDMSSLTASFTFTDFCNAIGYGDGGEQYRLFTAAVDECMQSVISVETGKVVRGKKSWEKFTWFDYAKFDAETGICTMIFSQSLATFLLELKKLYARINLSDIGQLQSRYGLHIYEMAKSYESLKGQNGNKSDEWYFERDIPELRFLFGVPDDTYQATKDFKKRVIEDPVNEINAAGIGISITSESIKQGKRIKGFRLNCKQTPRTTAKGKDRKKSDDDSVVLPKEPPKLRNKQTDKEMEHLAERYPEEFAELYAAALAKPSFLPPEREIRKEAAKGAALAQLRKKYGIVK